MLEASSLGAFGKKQSFKKKAAMNCEGNPCPRYRTLQSRSEQRGDDLASLRRMLGGYVNDWRNEKLTTDEAMILIQNLVPAEPLT